jgi:uncharacterized protein
MKLALLSDSHDNTRNLDIAIAEANKEECEILIHAGDLIKPSCVDHLQKFNGNVIFVFGNNDRDTEEIVRYTNNSNIRVAGDYYDDTIDGLRVYVTHYPHIAESMFNSDYYDLVVYGHTHKKIVETRKEKTLVNPGEIYGQRKGLATWAIYDTKSKAVEFKEVVYSD